MVTLTGVEVWGLIRSSAVDDGFADTSAQANNGSA